MSILNSRSEYNRCHIPRLVVEREEEGAIKEREQWEEKEREEVLKIMEQDDLTWEEGKSKAREQLGRGEDRWRNRIMKTMGGGG